MFSSNCSNGSISTSCSFICAPNQSSSRPCNALTNTYHPYGTNVKLAIEVTTTSPEELRNRRYKDKCQRLNQMMRQLVYKNLAIQSQVDECAMRLVQGQLERRYLLNKLVEFENHQNINLHNHTNTSRILLDALSNKTSIKSINSDTNQLSQTVSTIDHSVHNSPKPQADDCSASNHLSQSLSTQTIHSNSYSEVQPNKRIKLSDSHSNV